MPSYTASALLVTGPLEAAVRSLLRSLHYDAPVIVDAAVVFIATNGTATHADVIEPEHWGAVNDLLARHTGDAEGDPAHWPAWTDADRWEADETFEPDTADRLFWAQATEVDRHLDRMAEEAAALVELTRGLAPADLKRVKVGSDWSGRNPVRSRAAGVWTDADQARVGAL